MNWTSTLMMKETIYNPSVIDMDITLANNIWDNWFNDALVASAVFSVWISLIYNMLSSFL
ncbi:hypothetical protein [Gallibacterium anatis]|uniref:hypothetical protein n=2 Tax=Pasteurellaceae TaxID=712 RepID=UPI0012D2B8B7|nr:hypothetical protein [Gallibacterium anatis]